MSAEGAVSTEGTGRQWVAPAVYGLLGAELAVVLVFAATYNALDFRIYMWGGHAVLDDSRLYLALAYGHWFTYSPFAAIVFVPVAALPLAVARVGWDLVSVAALARYQQRQADADHARVQRFVDTATQTVVNMFSYKQDNIDQSVARFVDGTSGPLHGMLSSNNNVENIKALFRHTDANSEAVVNGAALESIDSVSDNASVLVSIRVTVTDLDGVNKPSMPYRMRVIVHEDENGRMTGYDLKYPDGGN